MTEEGYRYSKVKIVSWLIAMVLGALSWYCIYLVVKEVFSRSDSVPFHYSVHLLANTMVGFKHQVGF